MDVFFELFLKILPLYTIILFGFIGGRYLGVEKSSIAPLLLYLVVPVVTFKGIFETELSWLSLIYITFYFLACACAGLGFYAIGKWVYGEREPAALLSLASSLANVGYFGIPFVFMVMGEEYLGITILCIMGLTIHESTVAFFIAAKGKFTPKQALMKTLRIPTIYAALLAVVAHFLYNNFYVLSDNAMLHTIGDPLINSLLMTMDKFVGALTLLGMLIIGLGLAGLKKLNFDWLFIFMSFTAKFLFLPAAALGFLYFDHNYLHSLSMDVAKVIYYLSLVPIGANSITLAASLGLDTDKVSVTVMVSTIFALLFIPLIYSLDFLSLIYG